MLKIITRCDYCGKENDPFLYRVSKDLPWELVMGDLSAHWNATHKRPELSPKRQDACSRTCAQALDADRLTGSK